MNKALNIVTFGLLALYLQMKEEKRDEKRAKAEAEAKRKQERDDIEAELERNRQEQEAKERIEDLKFLNNPEEYIEEHFPMLYRVEFLRNIDNANFRWYKFFEFLETIPGVDVRFHYIQRGRSIHSAIIGSRSVCAKCEEFLSTKCHYLDDLHEDCPFCVELRKRKLEEEKRELEEERTFRAMDGYGRGF